MTDAVEYPDLVVSLAEWDRLDQEESGARVAQPGVEITLIREIEQ